MPTPSPPQAGKEAEDGPLLPPAKLHQIGALDERPHLRTSETQTQLRAGTYDVLWIVSFRVFSIGILVGCLALGAKRQVFGLREQRYNFFELSVDVQLAVFGIVNKILDYLVEDAVFHICGVTLTTWMALSRTGARTLDFQMQDEFTKPWITVLNLVRRVQLFGWRGIGLLGVLRFVVTLATAVSVLLLGAGVNTIGIPKERWAYGTELWTNRYRITSVEWPRAENIAYNMRFSFDGIQNRARTVTASECWLSTSGLWMATGDHPQDGWVEIYQDRWADAKTLTGVRVSETVVSSLSIQGGAVYDMWKSQAANGSFTAQSSQGWAGAFNVTLPIGTVSCVESTTGPAEAVTVTGPDTSTSTDGPAIVIVFGSSTTWSFPGATCTFTLKQGQYEVHAWIIDEEQPDISIDAYGTDRYLNVTSYDATAENRNILTQVATMFQDIVPIMDRLSYPEGFFQHLMSVREYLFRVGINSADPNTGLALAVAGMLQHLLTIARWELVEVDPGNDLVRSAGVRYQVYGSGPRLAWGWAIATVLGIIILLLMYDMFLTLRRRIDVGQWLSLSGMMVTANYTARMPMNDGVETDTIQKTKYFIRKMGSGSVHLTDEPDSGTVLSEDDWLGEDHNSAVVGGYQLQGSVIEANLDQTAGDSIADDQEEMV